MFTLCTRTVYLGADFYSDNARTFIFSDANVDCLSVDISLDLPQILGRQRLEENPWKNSAEFYYKTLKNIKAETDEEKKEKMDKEKYETVIAKKIEITNRIIATWQTSTDQEVLTQVFTDRVGDRKYKDDYVGINRHSGKTPKVVVNHLVMISERRAFDIQQVDYKDRFSVFNSIENTFKTNDSNTISEVKIALKEIELRPFLSDKLRYLCEMDLNEQTREIVENQMDERIREYLSLGKDRLKACGYSTTYLDQELNNRSISNQEELEKLVLTEFKEGDRR